MNHSMISYNNFSYRNQLSIELLRDHVKYNFLELIATLVNLVACLVSLNILRKSTEKYGSRTFFLLKLLFVNILLGCIYSLPITTWHIINGIVGIDEVYAKFTCYLINQLNLFWERNTCVITLMIAIDRLMVTFLKNLTINHYFNPSNPSFVFMLSIVLLLSILIQVLQFFDDYTDTLLVVLCTVGSSLGKPFGLANVFLYVLLTWLTFIVYIFMLICVRIRHANFNDTNNSSINYVEMKRTRKLTLVLTYTSVVYLIIAPMSFTVLSILAVTNPFIKRWLAPSVSWLLCLEAVFYTGSLLFTEDYREDFIKLFVFCTKCFKKNGVGQSVHMPTNINVRAVPVINVRPYVASSNV